MPKPPEIVQMTDIYGVPCDVHLVRTFRNGRSLGAGYDLRAPSAWFVYDRENANAQWHKHCGPYSVFAQAVDWINGIREVGEPDTAPIPLTPAMLDAIKTYAADDRLWASRSATEFNLCTFARVILKARADTQ